jgi:hypothetical protein
LQWPSLSKLFHELTPKWRTHFVSHKVTKNKSDHIKNRHENETKSYMPRIGQSLVVT